MADKKDKAESKKPEKADRAPKPERAEKAPKAAKTQKAGKGEAAAGSGAPAKARVPEDLTRLWLGHSKESITDFYPDGLKNDAAWRQDAQDRPQQGGFAAAGFADHAERFAFEDGEGYAVDRFDLADLAVEQTARDGEIFAQALG